MATEQKTSPLALLIFFVLAFVLGKLVYDKLIEPLVDAAYARWTRTKYNANANVVGDAVASSILEDLEAGKVPGNQESISIEPN